EVALGPPVGPPLEDWVAPVRAAADHHAAELAALPDQASRWRRLCEINVRRQLAALSRTAIVRAAWERGQRLDLHGWIYELPTGRLVDLDVSTDGSDQGLVGSGAAGEGLAGR
ncbi:MAG TPA: carbonic anhydrase, partial [Thermoanaerobaculia bacterium]|nr:carbonic anhydrase [Thermoanaerobaculia bacterium]